MRPETDGVPRRYDATAYDDSRVRARTTWRRSVVQRFFRIVRGVIGAPDYEAYLEHCRAAGHAPPLDERQYVAQFFESKGKGVRCC
jgi:uncharacterized short protein YbdD (DUF466 family)